MIFISNEKIQVNLIVMLLICLRGFVVEYFRPVMLSFNSLLIILNTVSRSRVIKY